MNPSVPVSVNICASSLFALTMTFPVQPVERRKDISASLSTLVSFHFLVCNFFEFARQRIKSIELNRSN